MNFYIGSGFQFGQSLLFEFEKNCLKTYNFTFELIKSDEKTKELLTEVLVEMIKEKGEDFQEIVLEAIEELGLANAIAGGRQGKFVSEEEIMSVLEG